MHRSAAERAAARHVAAYLLRPREPRAPLTLAAGAGTAGIADAEETALLARERRAVDALALALLTRGAVASEEADLIVDVARGDATPDDLRDYRILTKQSRCGLG